MSDTAPPQPPVRSVLFRIARNAGSILVGDAAGEVLNAVAIGITALSLGAAGFGQLSEAQAFSETFDTIAGFGLGQITIKIAADRLGCDGVLRGTVLGIRLVASLITVVLVLVSTVATGRSSLMPIMLVLCGSTLLTPFLAAARLPYEYEQTMHRRVALPFLSSVVRWVTAVFASKSWNTPVGFQLSNLASQVASTALSVGFAKRHYPEKMSFDRDLARTLLAAAWPAALLEFISMIYIRGGPYFLLHDYGAAIVGEFAAADRLVKPVFTIGTVFFASSLPTVAVMAARKEYQPLLSAFRKASIRIVLIAVPLLAIQWVAAPWLLQRFVPQYAGATGPFRALLPSVLFYFVTYLASIFIIALGYLRVVTLIATVNCIVYFSLALVLIPRFSGTGAALATTIMEGVNMGLQTGVAIWALRKHIREQAESNDVSRPPDPPPEASLPS